MEPKSWHTLSAANADIICTRPFVAAKFPISLVSAVARDGFKRWQDDAFWKVVVINRAPAHWVELVTIGYGFNPSLAVVDELDIELDLAGRTVGGKQRLVVINCPDAPPPVVAREARDEPARLATTSARSAQVCPKHESGWLIALTLPYQHKIDMSHFSFSNRWPSIVSAASIRSDGT